MKIGYLRQDESCHWYVIPKNAIEAFDDLSNKINEEKEYTDRWNTLIDLFTELYLDYMISNYQGIEVIIPEIENNRNETSEPTNY
jgi:hypoxanthine phosphoribosyltransferase